MVQTVLVTGTSGFIGHALASALAAADYRVVCVSRAPTPPLPAGPHPVVQLRADFADKQALAQQMEEHGVAKVDVCVHLGAVTGAASEEDALQVTASGCAVPAWPWGGHS